MSRLSLQQLDTGIDAVVANASSLIEEAELLMQSKFHARAYTLAHIAREELAKVTMFYSTGLRVLAGHVVDWKKLHKRLCNHKSKLTSDALLSLITTPGAADTLPIEIMLAGVNVRNDWKNDSLYVGFSEGKFVTPLDIITQRKAERTIALAQLILVDTASYLAQGGKLSERDPETAKWIFGSIGNPDIKDVNDALAFIKKLSKRFQEAVAASSKETKQSNVPKRSTKPNTDNRDSH